VLIPISRDVYGPVLDELRRHGIRFESHVEELA
jgi:hypothetical protein